MTDKAEEKVSKFYNTLGWATQAGVTEDARRWEDLRENARKYVSKCRLRVLKYIPDEGENILDMASGPIQYPEYLEYSRNFRRRYCVDLSSGALDAAKEKIGDHGVFLHGSFLTIAVEPNFFDCAVSLHTIYHIDKDRQEEAVRKLVDVIKPGKRAIIVYSNPNIFYAGLLNKIRKILGKPEKVQALEVDAGLYFHAHPLEWWRRYDDIAEVKIVPWRSFTSNAQKKLIPDNWLGRKAFDILFKLEDRFPNFFVKHLQYPMVILTKR